MEESLCDKISQLLKEKREELGLSVEQLAQQAKVPRSIVEAFERKDWDSLPEPVYVKGFLKKLCRVLGLDEKEIVDMFSSCELSRRSAPEIKRVSVTREKSFRVPVIFVILLALFLGGALFLYWGKPWFYKRGSSAVTSSANESYSKGESVEPENGSENETSNATGEIAEVREEKTSLNETAETEDNEGFSIVIKAVRGKSWYSLVVDNRKKRQGFIRKGESIDIRCREICSVKFGKPSAVEIYKGDEKILLPFDRPYTVVFTPDSFRILPK